MPRKPTRKALVAKADKVFSEYIRRRYANHKGIAECYTCGTKKHWKELQCGHFQSRKHYATRWNETNCQVQCAACNVFRYGEQFRFGRNLDIEFGNGTAEGLYQLSSQVMKYTNFELVEMIEHYKEKLAQLDKL